MHDRKRIIATTAAILAVILLAAAWCAWRQHVTRTATPHATHTATIATSKPHKTTTTPTPTMPALDTLAITQTAVAFEHAAHDWGTDPTTATDENTLSGMDTDRLLGTVRTPEHPLDTTSLDATSTIPHGKTAWDKPSIYCREEQSRDSTWCTTLQPTNLDYWRNQHWTMGARLDGDPTVTIGKDGKATAKGRIKCILWTNADESNGTITVTTGKDGSISEWSYTPFVGYVDYTDTLTIRDNKVTARTTSIDPTDWIADPYYGDWTATPDWSSWKDSGEPTIWIQGTAPSLYDQSRSVGYLGIDIQHSVRIVKNNPDIDE